VGVLNVQAQRGYLVANVHRFAEGNSALRRSTRIADLAPGDLRAFCDWEACIRTNGYNHSCWVDDGGVERCKVCDGSADCNGRPLSQGDCVAHAVDPGRLDCHVGLLQECLIQRALRGSASACNTESCRWSDQACSGLLPGDLTARAIVAQHETDQVTVGECGLELVQSAKLLPDGGVEDLAAANQLLSLWDGGLAACDQDAWWLSAVVDGGTSDVSQRDP
jgi:hypothetical protein